jgi:predicted DNA binding CopG/RHH family protein
MTISSPNLKPFPTLTSDKEAEDFVANSDLTQFDWSDMKPFKFEFQPKDTSVNLRLPKALLDAVRQRAQADGMPYQRYIRWVLEQSLG